MDGANNHPLITWGSTDFTPFLKAKPVDENSFSLPLQLVFAQPYPNQYEMADLLMLDTLYTASDKLKDFFEKQNMYGVQFVPADITDNKKKTITGNYVLHIWNKLEAIDKDNYEGDEPDEDFGKIFSLQRFSLDSDLLNSIPLKERLVFALSENDTITVVHESIYQAIQAAGLTGMRFWKVSEWDEDAMFR
jgi:hypothetical protein